VSQRAPWLQTVSGPALALLLSAFGALLGGFLGIFAAGAGVVGALSYLASWPVPVYRHHHHRFGRWLPAGVAAAVLAVPVGIWAMLEHAPGLGWVTWVALVLGGIATVSYFFPGIAADSALWSRLPRSELDEFAPRRLKSVLPMRAVVRILSGGGGSVGFLVSHRGYVVTNCHCVEGASSVEVVLENGEMFPARVVAARREWDLAVVKIDTPYRLPTVRLARDSEVRLGMPVATVGLEPISAFATTRLWTSDGGYSIHPDGPVVAAGTLANVAESWVEGGIPTLIVAGTGLVRRGYSGSPICDARTGRVVGVHNGGYGAGEAGQAIPARFVWELLAEAQVAPRGHALWQMPDPEDEEGTRRHWRFAAHVWVDTMFPRYGPEDLKDPELANWVKDVIGQYRESLGDEEPGLRVLEAALRFAEGDAEGAAHLARHGLGTRSGYWALGVLFQASTENPELQDLMIGWIGDVLDARRGSEGYIASHERADLRAPLLRLLIARRRFDEADGLAEQGEEDAKAADASGFLYYKWGEALLGLGRPDAAIVKFDQSINAYRREDGSEDDWTQLIRALVEVGDPRSLKRAIDLGIWHLSRPNVPHEAIAWAATAAERLEHDATAAWLRELSAALDPETARPPEPKGEPGQATESPQPTPNRWRPR
jgi:S1-C subfamily serine protease/tetratricopeptide (TPR) repeat protein